ncbi:exonuclease SbcC [Anaerobacterium chartisolvens]|uniref:Nuclease SbcCD subunit C n=1 Tax=Anaerobacterium chartisolvens TaxID=1297424 RepID=A0A369AL96_9FIRM|nr:AAA family ATPase [Anaerobacterium chartisolvens]RCX09893.1 exonuclease SbcC [Anaerobacterium chartisolvens]
MTSRMMRAGEVRGLRPKYLEIEGLQSFRQTQKIDFDCLSETGLFGIFGPTGSGKSTVLDAITLALFGEVNRAARGTQGIINTDCPNLRVSFIFDLLKNNIRRTYKIERVYKRKKGTQNSCEAKIVRLIEITLSGDIPIADKQGEVNEKIEELIGLRPEDFTRSAVLPQNKFQEFLMLEKAKKREMLERIFYLEEYGRQLTEKVSRKISEIRYRLSNIQGAISSLGDASDKTLIEAESRLEAARLDKEKADNKLKLTELKLNEAKELWIITEELNQYIKREEELLICKEETALKRQIYEASINADGLAYTIKKYRSACEIFEETCRRLEDADKSFDAVEKQQSEAQRLYEEIIKKARLEKPVLIERKAKLNHAMEELKGIAETEEQLKGLRDRYTVIKSSISVKSKAMEAVRLQMEAMDKKANEYRTEIEELKVDIDHKARVQSGISLENEVRAVKHNAEAARLKYQSLTAKLQENHEKSGELTEQRQKLQALFEELEKEKAGHEARKPYDRDSVMKEISVYHEIKNIYERLKSSHEYINGVKVKLEKINADIAAKKKDCAKALKEKEEKERELDELNRELEHFKRLYEMNTAHMLAKGLNDNEPCPVCGSLVHPQPAINGSDEGIREAESRLKEMQEKQLGADRRHREAEGRCIRLSEALSSMEAQAAEIAIELRGKESEFLSVAKSLPPELENLNPYQIRERLEEINEISKDKLEKIGKWEERLEILKGEGIKISEMLSEKKAEEKAKKAELSIYQEDEQQAKKTFEEWAQAYNDRLKELENFIKECKISGIASELKRIEENERRSERLQKMERGIQQDKKELAQQMEDMDREERELVKDLEETRIQGDALKHQRDERESKIRLITGDRNINELIREAEESIKDIENKESSIFKSLKDIEQKFNDIKTHKNMLSNQKEIYSQAVTEEAARLENMLEQKGFASSGEAEKALLPKEKQQALRAELDDYEKTERNVRAQKAILTEKLKGRSISREEWEEINSLYGLCIEEKEKSISLYERAKNIYNVVKENFTKWVTLDKELKEFNKRYELLEHIQKLLKGNSFIDFIAEERLKYIAAEATETLGLLTRYRYAIELDSESGFVIRDNFNGGFYRPVSSLSGGEIFLTALSLALALSKQVQLKGKSPLEFFFLDEGFGTLDGSLLDTVIDSLERLSNKDRVIGLISHVPELKNRITRRLIIEPPNMEGNGSKVKIEKA